jgi:hypothetical protein
MTFVEGDTRAYFVVSHPSLIRTLKAVDHHSRDRRVEQVVAVGGNDVEEEEQGMNIVVC